MEPGPIRTIKCKQARFDTDPAAYRRPPETLQQGSHGPGGEDELGQKHTTGEVGRDQRDRLFSACDTASPVPTVFPPTERQTHPLAEGPTCTGPYRHGNHNRLHFPYIAFLMTQHKRESLLTVWSKLWLHPVVKELPI
ncbi:hypothetical protein NQZ68_029100 [Dissostichus eleginoides]|nr:hypothetical protein NQZ68_029100 [Dissostichus eleginoides]